MFHVFKWKKTIESSGGKRDKDKINGNIKNNQFYNFETKTFKLENAGAASVPFNKRVVIPPLANDDYKSKISLRQKQIRENH